MKKTFIIFSIILNSILFAKAQDDQFVPFSSFGIKQGINYSTVLFSPGIAQSTNLGYQGGLVYKYNNQMYPNGWVFALQMELNYMQKGWTEDLSQTTNLYKRRLDYLELPFITQLVIGKRSLKYYLNIGTSFGYLLSEKEKLTINDELYRREYYEKKVEKSFDYTGLGELGVIIDSKIGSFQVGVRYQYSLIDLFTVTSDTYFNGSKSTVWSFSITYFIFDNKQ